MQKTSKNLSIKPSRVVQPQRCRCLLQHEDVSHPKTFPGGISSVGFLLSFKPVWISHNWSNPNFNQLVSIEPLMLFTGYCGFTCLYITCHGEVVSVSSQFFSPRFPIDQNASETRLPPNSHGLSCIPIILPILNDSFLGLNRV